MFDKMKQVFEMQKSMQELKRQLEETSFDVLSSDGLVKINMSGAQKVNKVLINGNLAELDKAALEKSILDVYNRAVRQAQEVAALKLKGISGLSLPGQP